MDKATYVSRSAYGTLGKNHLLIKIDSGSQSLHACAQLQLYHHLVHAYVCTQIARLHAFFMRNAVFLVR